METRTAKGGKVGEEGEVRGRRRRGEAEHQQKRKERRRKKKRIEEVGERGGELMT